jgi:hypothetical protein
LEKRFIISQIAHLLPPGRTRETTVIDGSLCPNSIYSKTAFGSMSDPSPAFSTTGSDSGSASMGYQYATPSPGMDSSGNVIPSFHHFPRNHTQPGSPALTQSTTSEDPSKPASSRSTSTPDVPGQEATDAAALALSAEKRRNKLGYHRTSVACGERALSFLFRGNLLILYS